jgi:insulysin
LPHFIGHYRDILLAIFKFINFYRSSPPSDEFYAEIQAINALRFRFSEKSTPDSYAKSLTKYLKYTTPRELVLSGPSLIFDRNNEEVKELLQLLVVEKCCVTLAARDHFDMGEDAKWTNEPWYGTEYVIKKLEEEFMSEVGITDRLT